MEDFSQNHPEAPRILYFWSKKVPVDDAMLVKKHECWRDLCSIKAGSRFVKFAWALDLKHQVSSIYIFHDEKEAVLKLIKQCYLANFF